MSSIHYSTLISLRCRSPPICDLTADIHTNIHVSYIEWYSMCIEAMYSFPHTSSLDSLYYLPVTASAAGELYCLQRTISKSLRVLGEGTIFLQIFLIVRYFDIGSVHSWVKINPLSLCQQLKGWPSAQSSTTVTYLFR